MKLVGRLFLTLAMCLLPAALAAQAAVVCSAPPSDCIVCPDGQFRCAGPPSGGTGPVVMDYSLPNTDILHGIGKNNDLNKVLKDLKDPPLDAHPNAFFRGQ